MRSALLVLALVAACAAGASGEASVALGARLESAPRRAALGFFSSKEENDAKKAARDAKVSDDFKNLEEAETLAEQAIDAAEKDGDLEEAEMQQEARTPPLRRPPSPPPPARDPPHPPAPRCWRSLRRR